MGAVVRAGQGLVVRPCGGDVFWDVDQDGAGPAHAGDRKALTHDVGELVHVADHVVPLGDGHRDARDVDLLEGVLAQNRLAHVAGDGDDGGGVHVGGREAGREVGRAGARGGQAHAHLAGRAGVAVGRMRRGLLMAHKVMLDRGFLIERVVDVENRAAGVAEDRVDPLLPQAGDDDLCTGEQHGVLLPALIICKRLQLGIEGRRSVTISTRPTATPRT